MLVKYKLVGAAGVYALLFDESAGDANEKFNPSFRDNIDKNPGYGSPSQSRIPLSNTEGTITFKWSSNYVSADAGMTAIATLRATFKGVAVHLQIIMGATTVYFPNAILSTSSHDQHGREVLHQLTFDTDDITTIAQ